MAIKLPLVAHLEEEALEQAGLQGHCPLLRVGVRILHGVDRGLNGSADLRRSVQEVDDVIERFVFQQNHVLAQGLTQRQEAALRVVPRVHTNLALVRLQGLHDSADAELEVALGAIQGADDQVDDAQVVDRLGRICHLLLLLLHQPHELLGLLVGGGHDVGHAEVRQDDGRDAQQVVVVFPDKGLVVADALLELLLHEEDVGDVELPRLVLRAELGGLAENLLDHGVMLHVPIDLGLAHEHGHVLRQRLIELVQVLLHKVLVPVPACVLDVLGAPSQGLDVLGRELVEPPVGLLGRRLGQDQCIQELVVLWVHVLVSQLRVLRQDISSQVEVAVLAIQQEQVDKGLRRRWMLTQQEVQLPEAFGGLCLHLNEGLVVERDLVQLRLVPRRHVVQGVLGRLEVLHHILDGRLQVEGLN
mmetsp:Transcript_118046/g.376387  ORF Transcript_118046/g.376387 Transcript_118046/m.376387 type:complete len:416 (-) Transcript_118046:800-2047(-)